MRPPRSPRPLALLLGLSAAALAACGGGSSGPSAPIQPPGPVLAFTAVSPAQGPAAGGAEVVIDGDGFTAATLVRFGGAASPQVTVEGPRRLRARAPAHGAGPVDVEVDDGAGHTAIGRGAFRYDDAPVVSFLEPGHVPQTGGSVILHGQHFAPGARVFFGGVPAAGEVRRPSDTQLVAVAAAHEPATVDVAVENPDGQRATLPAALRFDAVELPPPPPPAAPVLSAVAPTSGPETGGTVVTLTGASFDPAATVTFGGAPATVTGPGATELTVVAPPHAPGDVEVAVANPDGQRSALPAAFAYVAVPAPAPSVSTVAPPRGPTAGGTTVTIAGAHLDPGAAVTFGGAPALVLSTAAEGLVVSTPAHAAGPADVVVTNPDGQSATVAGAFTFEAPPPPPAISAVSPASGPIAGGTVITVSGAGFEAGATVTVGGVAAAVQAVGAAAITATTPPHAAGVVAVAVVNPDGRVATLPAAYAYLAPPPPALTSLAPTSGPDAGGTTVVLVGDAFADGAVVTFGGLPAPVIARSATSLTVTAPAHAAGPVDVAVLNPDGRQATLAAAFAYLPPPEIAAVAPPGGPSAGGTAVTVTGTGFLAATVTIGGAVAPVAAATATSLLVTAPPGVPGAADVVVRNGDGRAARLPGGFSYAAPPPPPPTVSGVSPASGPIAGGTRVTVSGAGFDAGAGVAFGGAPGVVTSATATALVVTAPAHAAGAVDVTVTNGDGQVSNALPGAFAYLAPPPPPPPPPSLTAVSPAAGPTAGGTSLVLSGAAFQAGVTVTVGGRAAPVTAFSTTSLTATAPAHSAGPVAVAVVNPDGGSATLAGAFTYLAPPPPTLAALTPAEGPDAGGTAVTLAGTGFQPGATVTFGGVAAAVGEVTATAATVTAPAHAAGVVDVVLTNPDGLTAALPAAFTYAVPPPPVLPAPVLATVLPAAGPAAGGAVVILSGAGFQPGASVAVGGLPAAVTAEGPTALAITTPPHPAGAADVTVTNPDGQAVTLPAAYVFVAPPVLVAVAPAAGPVGGGTAVTLSGSGFLAGATVAFGGAAAVVSVLTFDTISAVTPPHAAGAVAVTVTNPDGQASGALAAGFTYALPAPVITAVSPAGGSTLGGTAVTVSGSGFVAGATLTVGGSPAAIGSLGATALTFTAPAHAAGPADVTVTNPDGQAATAAGAFTFAAPPPPPPVVSGVSPASGPVAGGTTITVAGTGFRAGAAVALGDTPATVTAVTATAISAVTPPHLAGPVAVTVTNADGQRSAALPDAFTFVAPPPPPVLATVLPATGFTAGGTAVALSGADFQAGATVTFGGAAAAVVSIAPTAIAVVTPAHAAGAVDVVVRNPDGLATTLPSAFTFVAPPPPPPSLSGLSPVSGPTAGGTGVTLTGGAFAAGATVAFGGVPAAVGAVTASTIAVTTPAHAAGPVDVTVTNPDGQQATLAGAFGFVAPPPPPAPPVLASASPGTGPTAGGTAVSLVGTGFAAGATVTFGGAVAAVGALTATSIAVTTPAHAAGAVAVTVTNPDGQATTLGAGFTFVAPPPPPAVASATPAAGPAAGGTAVVLAGSGFASGATVTLGGAVAAVTGVTASAISLTTPAHAAGAVDVVVTNPDGQTSTLAGGFTFVAPPAPPSLAGVAPSTGPTAGGTAVTLSGAGFAAGVAVSFGGAAAAVGAVTATSIAVTAPPGAAGAVDVVVTNPDGLSSTLAGAFTYTVVLGPPPAISAVTPASGFNVGGTTVTITGAEFANPFVFFGGASATVTATSKTSLTVTTPPHAPGVVDVVVQNPDGQLATRIGGYTYVQVPSLPAPVVTGITPAAGPITGNTAATVLGTGFVTGATVTIGGTPAIVGAITATSIAILTAGGPAGPADVTVTNPDLQAGTLAGGYTYVAPPPVVTAINVRGSPQAGGGLLLFAGSGLANTVGVTFGGAPATGLTYDPVLKTLTVTVPPSPLGPTADGFVDLVLTNLDGQSATWPNFHYGNPPAPASFTPTIGAKGDTMVVTGTDFTADTSGLRVGLTVSFGGTAGTVTAKTPTSITVTVPKLNPGVYQVVVINFDSQFAVAPGTFTVPGP